MCGARRAAAAGGLAEGEAGYPLPRSEINQFLPDSRFVSSEYCVAKAVTRFPSPTAKKDNGTKPLRRRESPVQEAEIELGLTLPHMTQKPVLWVVARARS